MQKLEKLIDGFNLIEGPIWKPELGLVFSDAVDGGVYALSPAGQLSEVLKHRKGIGGIVSCGSKGLIVSGRNVALKLLDGSKTLVLINQSASEEVMGFNDMTTDTLGRIYAGSLGPSGTAAQSGPAVGKLFLIDNDATVREVASGIRLSNGLALSADGFTLYHSDSLRGRIFQYSVMLDGSLGHKTLFAKVRKGGPDGLAVAVDGTVWVALAGGHGVSVFDSTGSEVDFIEISEPFCTSLCFGDVDRKTLYIVSGSEGTASSTAGSIYRMRLEVAGVLVHDTAIDPG